MFNINFLTAISAMKHYWKTYSCLSSDRYQKFGGLSLPCPNKQFIRCILGTFQTPFSASLLYSSKELLRRSFPKPRRPEFIFSLANSWVNRSPAVQKEQLKETRAGKKGSFCLGLPAAISSQSNQTFHVKPWKLSQSFEIAKRSRKQQPEAKWVFPCQGLPAVPLLQDPKKGMLEMNQAISHEKNVHEEERSTNPAFSVLLENTCPRRVIKDKHSTVQNTDTVSMAWYLGLLKPARLTAISSAGGKALWNWAVSSRCYWSVSHCCSPSLYTLKANTDSNVLTVKVLIKTLYTAIESLSVCKNDIWI